MVDNPSASSEDQPSSVVVGADNLQIEAEEASLVFFSGHQISD
jgi:hypothetical protein